MISEKQELGQFYTTNYNYILNDIVIPDNITRIIEPFAKNGEKIWTTELSGDNFYQNSERTTLFTSIGISFKYTFGKLNFKTNSKRSKISNDDIKEENDNEM